ncbi:MAG: S-methyl-5-thioribose-1-phosphate isomerase [Methylotenera sp.]
MKINGQNMRTIWTNDNSQNVNIINQILLPHAFAVEAIDNLETMVTAIKTMQVRGAPLIGVAAAFGMALAMQKDATDAHLRHAANLLIASRPTAVNLTWAVSRMIACLQGMPLNKRALQAWYEAARMAEEDVAQNQKIGEHGLNLIKNIYKNRANPNKPLNIMTHCNAGWLATVDYGTALAPVYAAHDAGLNIHVWVSETRPRNQGAALTAWELAQHGVPHTVITDNAGGHLMQQGLVELVIVGADRVTSKGDVCNKIGTYLKALAAYDNGIPFYAAVPTPTIDWSITDPTQIEIEHRHGDELAVMQGLDAAGKVQNVRILHADAKVLNPAFDVTPAKLVTGIITEQGVYTPNQLRHLYKT